jgi:hypothetical protein
MQLTIPLLYRYLRFYEVSAVKQFIDAVSGSDMSHINLMFVSSVPGSHKARFCIRKFR